MFDRRTVSLFAALTLAAGCKSKEPDKNPPGAAAPKSAEPSPSAASPTCLPADALDAKHPSTEFEPCASKVIEDLNRDGMAEMQVACGLDSREMTSTIYVQGPRGCFTAAGAFIGGWYLEEPAAPVNGFLTVRSEVGVLRDNEVPLYYAYDPSLRAYRQQRDPKPRPAATVVLPDEVLRLGGIAGITGGEPGFRGPRPECCDDACEALMAPLREVEAVVAPLTGEASADQLAAVAAELRSHGWSKMIPHLNDTRRTYLDGLARLGDAFAAVATALDDHYDDDDPEARLEDLATDVTRLLALAAELGEDSQSICGED